MDKTRPSALKPRPKDVAGLFLFTVQRQVSTYSLGTVMGDLASTTIVATVVENIFDLKSVIEVIICAADEHRSHMPSAKQYIFRVF